MVVNDENHINEAIVALQAGAGHAVGEIAQQTYQRIDSQWDAGKDATGAAWSPLASETIRRKGNSNILEDSGDMRQSFGYEVDRTSATARVGTNSDLAVYHEMGVPERSLPARPILEPAARYAEKELVEDAFSTGFVRAFANVVL